MTHLVFNLKLCQKDADGLTNSVHTDQTDPLAVLFGTAPFVYTYNTKFNDLRKIICLRKSEVSVESISVCNVIEKFGGVWHTLSAMLLYQ